MGVLDEMGDQLARDVIVAIEELDDPGFFDRVSKVLLDASPTMQEAFLTAYRVRIAEKRARAFIDAALKAKRDGKVARRVHIDTGGH